MCYHTDLQLVVIDLACNIRRLLSLSPTFSTHRLCYRIKHVITLTYF